MGADHSDFDRFIKQVKSYFPHIKINTKNLRSIPWPTCELALTSLEANQDVKDSNNLKIESTKKLFKKNDMLDAKINLQVAQGFLSVFYLQADGTAVQIIKDKDIDANAFTLAKLRSEDDLIISAPFGHEAIVAVLTEDKGLIPLSEEVLADRNFLTQFRIKLFELTKRNQLISISLAFVETSK